MDKDFAEIPDLEEYIKDIKILAAKIHKKYAVKGMELEDLISEGIVGLYDAYRRFDGSRGTSFKTYSRYRIKGSILDSIRRWLPCNHQTEKQKRKDLITQFEKHAELEHSNKTAAELDEPMNYISDSDMAEKLLSVLTEESKEVIKGIIQENKTLGEVAEGLGISKGRVVNLRDASLRTMKEEAKKLEIDCDTIFSNRTS